MIDKKSFFEKLIDDEIKGSSFGDLNEYLGFASSMGTFIEITTNDGILVSGYLCPQQDLLPKAIVLFNYQNDIKNKTYSRIATDEIKEFTLKSYGNDEHSVETGKLIIVADENISGSGIDNYGNLSIYSKEININGNIETMKNNPISGSQGISGKNVNIGKLLSTGGTQTVSATNNIKIEEVNNRTFSHDIENDVGKLIQLIEQNDKLNSFKKQEVKKIIQD